MFARFMRHCNDKEKKRFVPLTSLKVDGKQMIADAVLFEVSFFKKKLTCDKKEYQTGFDSLL